MESTPQRGRTAAVRPAAPYIGGKRHLAKRIVDLIESVPHDLYAEPFVGMGGVFLRRRAPAKVEVINDLSRDIATFFRVLQRHEAPFLEMLRYQISTREEFDRQVRVDPDTLTDLERAARFLCLQKWAFGGKVAGRNFGMVKDPGHGSRFDAVKLRSTLEDLHARLARVTIERLPYARFVQAYDGPRSLFYVDPPYWGSEDVYGATLFAREDFARLRDVLAKVRGRFILSINDVPPIREIFAAFNLAPVSHHWSIASGAIPAKELIVTNWV